MWPFLTGLMTGGMNLMGSMFTADQSAANNQANIAFQQQTNQQNQQFTQEMSNTAYQRASADMQKAGLNPSLMFGSGGPASSPVGQAQAPRQEKVSPLGGIGDAVVKGLQGAISAKTIDEMTSRIARTNADTANIEQDTLRQKLDRARQEWEAMHYLDLSNIPDAARKAGNVASWGAQKVGDVLGAVGSSAAAASRLYVGRSPSTAARTVVDMPSTKVYSGLSPSQRQVVKDTVQEQMSNSAKQSETFRDWNKKIDAVREQFQKDNPGFYGEGR